MKTFMEEYGLIVVAAIIIMIFVLVATPIGTSLKDGVKTTLDKYTTITEEIPTDHIIVDEYGYYRVNGEITGGAGLVKIDGEYYFVPVSGRVTKDTAKFIYEKDTNGLLPEGGYIFDKDGKIVKGFTGIMTLSGEDYYLLEGSIMTNTTGLLVKVDEDIYYVTPSGKIKKNFTSGISATQANGLVKPGEYTFGEDGKMILPTEE